MYMYPIYRYNLSLIYVFCNMLIQACKRACKKVKFDKSFEESFVRAEYREKLPMVHTIDLFLSYQVGG